MKHRSHLKQVNKQFKKNKTQKKNKNVNKKAHRKKKKTVEKYSHMLHRAYQAHNTKSSNLKNELEEKSKYVPIYNSLNICLLPFHEDVDVLSFKREFIKYICEQNEDDSINYDNIQLYDIYTIHSDKTKRKRSLVVYDVPRNIYGIIDGTKCADLILCIFKDGSLENSAFDNLGYELLSILKIQGVPSIIGIGYNTSENKKYSKNFVSRYFNSEFTMDDKIFFINSSNNSGTVENNYDITRNSDNNCSNHNNTNFHKLYYEIMNMKVKNVSFREGRGYMMIDSYVYNPYNDSIYLKGFVKGTGFNVHNPIHITNIGDYYLDGIYAIDAMKRKRNVTNNNINNCNYDMNREASKFFLNKNIQINEENEKCFIANFLNNEKITTNINYNFYRIQNCINRNTLDDENNLIPVRPYMGDDNHFNDKNMMMVLKKQNMSELSQFNLNHEDDNNNNNNTTVYKFNLNREMGLNTNEPSNEYNNHIYTMNTNLANGNNMERMNGMNEFGQFSNNENTQNMANNNKWMYVSNEKYEASDNAICSYDRSQPINDIQNGVVNNCLDNKDGLNDAYFLENNSEDSENEKFSDNNSNESSNSDSDDNNNIEIDDENSEDIYLSKKICARERFKKYRSLQSLRTSFIDVYEDLPLTYSRVYDYECHENLMKYSKKKYIENCKIIQEKYSLADTYCIFVIKNDGNLINLMNSYEKLKLPFILSSILPFERKVTVVNMEIEKSSTYLEKVQSKDIFKIICGFRHFIGAPIFSEQIIKSIQSKGKYEKFVKHGKKYIASIFGFTTVTSSPVFIIKTKNIINYGVEQYNNISTLQNMGNPDYLFNTNNVNSIFGNGNTNNIIPVNPLNDFDTHIELVAHGKVVNCDCKRIIMKRISICGNIFKIHKKKAVIRNMFYNPKDINYFKPVELHTKFGLTGKILESLGTHGKMKCLFSSILKQHDKVFMFLYKRVYPVWFPIAWGGDPQLGPNDKPLANKNEHKMVL
ncbi:ribosome biogenesis protein TSR1, putative [Plasmodium berghei]|uniref:Ribosome biogenesis protein TSR1, putative n=2 Tax=Plasmodium berghei TaxID=5821 RepID=A0A509ANE9_PLABA|nr:ribosome biogenesis protein TSR1, putative [Plasmodium berghei ANKA]CXI91570.1 ribosome biogenesis protein TSR1, putative [Plasmodium berghei]SCL96480.1 ribosome biogenesis protein TSR1, putative [Plasmodium berghei]SCM16431.1 ribosome biogenesis protein TSR1, putative [Plasmodium berghei]SCN27653.1 ribosome biogenesis protein TSR1, putative [Plasmodium berghei]VUC57537.1 ribosome biogenesis protein TSR1, putative [Plasmodium berghei ANKA]|eukprot:XP_034423308.1 ribosome biogenesis protein TSR1, putative [Plasmodium berghei ANKA]